MCVSQADEKRVYLECVFRIGPVTERTLKSGRYSETTEAVLTRGRGDLMVGEGSSKENPRTNPGIHGMSKNKSGKFFGAGQARFAVLAGDESMCRLSWPASLVVVMSLVLDTR